MHAGALAREGSPLAAGFKCFKISYWVPNEAFSPENPAFSQTLRRKLRLPPLESHRERLGLRDSCCAETMADFVKPGAAAPVPEDDGAIKRIRITLTSRNVRALEKVCADLKRGALEKELQVRGPVRLPTKKLRIVTRKVRSRALLLGIGGFAAKSV
eukprot:scaffold48_cov311-Pinguiococcus_pyrenoidosus.AAC.315